MLVDATHTANAVCGFHGAHAYTGVLLGETLVSSLLLASGLKGNGTVRVKFQFSGDISYTAADSTPLGLVRGMIPAADLRGIGEFEPMLSPPIMSVKKLDESGSSISEGMVEMPSGNVGAATAFYLLQSEQTKSAAGVKAKTDAAGAGLAFCAGFLVEALPKADSKTLAILEEVVRSLPDLSTYAKEGEDFDLLGLLNDLAGPFPVRVHREIPVTPFCPCSRAGVLQALSGLGREELEEIAMAGKETELHCEYCRKRYTASADEVRDLLRRLNN